MTDQAQTMDVAKGLSREAMLAGLHDIRLPATAAGGAIAEIAAAVAIGAVGALVVGIVLRNFSRREKIAHPLTLEQQLAALADAPEDDRRLAVLHLMKHHMPGRLAELRHRLYRREGGLDTDALMRELSRDA